MREYQEDRFDNEGGAMLPTGPAWLEEDDYEDFQEGSGLVGVLIGAVSGAAIALLATWIF